MRAWLVTVLLVVGAPMAAAPTALADQGASSNWAGYAIHGTSFRHVSGTWRQPSVSCVRGRATFSAFWVGLGGFFAGSQALEQIGTEADCALDGHASLSAWYEMVPAASQPISMRIDPGDTIVADVTVAGHRATLALTDRTRHRGFRIAVVSPFFDVTSAEWIVEAPSDCPDTCTTLPLADFRAAVFTGARAQSTTGHAGAIRDHRWAVTSIRLGPAGGSVAMAGSAAGASAALPSALSRGGSSFTVSWARVLAPRHARLARPRRSGGLRRPALAAPR